MDKQEQADLDLTKILVADKQPRIAQSILEAVGYNG